MPMSRPQSFAKLAMERYPYLRIKNVYHEIASLRLIKSEEEIEFNKRSYRYNG